MPDLKIEMLDVQDLKPCQKNARTHSKKQIKQLASSITEYTFTNPILIDEDNIIIAGHGRLEAAKLCKLKALPCVRLSHLSDAQKHALRLADNKLALNAGWDDELLAEALQEILTLDEDFDIQLTGFSIAETDIIIEGNQPEEACDPDDDVLPDPAIIEARVQYGDVWLLGSSRLVCGDALDTYIAALLMDGRKADMVFTDPPYNVKIDGNVCGKGSIKHKEFEMASGEMGFDEFVQFLAQALRNHAQNSHDGSIHLIFMDWRHMRELQDAAEGIYSELKNLIVWAKDNGGMGTFYRSRHELIFAYKYGDAPHYNSFELGQHGRYRTNVWEYKGMNSHRAGRLDDLAMHPTVKPVQMIADAIKDVSPRGGIVLDLFAGSGSTLIAAHKTGRRAYLAEIDPHYCDVILKRWETYTHDDAVLLHRETTTAKDEHMVEAAE